MASIVEYMNMDEPVPFVNVDTEEDTLLFLQPRLFRLQEDDPFAAAATLVFDDFSRTALGLLRSDMAKDHRRAQKLFSELPEPYETRLGYACNSRDGKGTAEGLGEKIYQALTEDIEALVKVLVFKNLESLPMFVEHIDRDRVSDMTTCIIKGVLLDFTELMISQYPELAAHEEGLAQYVFTVWDPEESRWMERAAMVPVVGGQPLILVPKSWVAPNLLVSARRFHGVGVLGYVQDEQSFYGYDGRVMRTAKKTLRKQFPENRTTNQVITLRAWDTAGLDLVGKFDAFVDAKYYETRGLAA